ncbi:MAG: DUF4340 domain-containing protein [Deltaproteobacteria bacterium]|nr:DUF4340 domain-containing protein [Deltaproteobacteria bacterium]
MGFRTATLGTLGALAVGLLVPVVLVSLRPAAPDRPRLVPAGADVVALELQLGAPLRLDRVARSAGGDDWRIAGEGGGPADPGVVDAMLAALETARPVRAIRLEDPTTPPAALGLSPPRGTVRLRASDGAVWTVEFGAPTAGESRVHLRSSLDPGLVWVAEDSLRRSVARTPAQLRDRRLWSLPPARVLAVEWHDGGSSVRVERTADGFRVTPPGTLADPERAARLFELAAAPRASGFPDDATCVAAATTRLVAEDADGRHELAFAEEPAAGAGPVTCADGRTAAIVGVDLLETPRALVPFLARAPLFGTLDPDAVIAVAVQECDGRWSLRRGPEGWQGEGLGFEVDAAAANGWLRRLALAVVEPERFDDSTTFVAAGSVELSVRGRAEVRVERTAAAPDGTIAVRRAGESVVFRLSPEESYLLASPQAHLTKTGTACDPLAAVRFGVREVLADGTFGAVVQVLERRPEAGWTFDDSPWPVDVTAVDLLLGELCRLSLQPRIGPATAAEARWTVRVVDREGRELLSAAVLAAQPGRDVPAVLWSGESDARPLSEAGWRRLLRPMVAAEALALRREANASRIVVHGDGKRLALSWDGTAWTSPGLPAAVASSVGAALAAPAWREALALSAPDESAGWPVRYRVERRAADDAPAQEWRIGGPDASGRLLLWDVETGALFELDAALPGVLELALRLAE